jgi:hypothetical protein
MKKLLLACLLSITAQAQVILAPNDSVSLDKWYGDGTASVYWVFGAVDAQFAMTSTVPADALGGYILDRDRQVVQSMAFAPTHFYMLSLVPDMVQEDVWYFLATGAAGLAVGDPLIRPVTLTEPWLLDGPGVNPLVPVIPEPANAWLVGAVVLGTWWPLRRLVREMRRL